MLEDYIKLIFINLPVKNAAAWVHFYTRLGFSVNPLFTFEDQKCMVWSDQIFVMLQTYQMFRSGTVNISLIQRKTPLLHFTFPVDSVDQLNRMTERGLKAGNTEILPARDEGFMQVRTLSDPDGHTWGLICLGVQKFRKMRDN